MPLAQLRLPAGADDIQERIAAVRAQLPGAIAQTLAQAAKETQAALQQAAPVGKIIEEATTSGAQSQQPRGLPGDGPGKLADSFQVQQVGDSQVDVLTTQPAKLKIIVEGRGPVYPKTKMALMWPGLTHPVKRAGPTTPNDFVSPVLASVPDRAVTEAAALFIDPVLATLGGE